MKNRKTIGLALGSGGVRGLAHIGVIKTLIKHGIPIDYLSGASIGSWVAAHFALYQNIELTADFTAGKKKEKLFSFLELTFDGGLIKGKKVQDLLDDWLANASFSELKIPLKIAATDLVTGEKVIFSDGKLATAVRASMTVPGVFKPVVVENRILVDGGLSNPVPVDLVKDMGADIVIAVNLDYFESSPNEVPKKFGFHDVGLGTMRIMKHYLAQYSCQGADFIIQPSLKNFTSTKDYFLNDNDGAIIRLMEEETEKIIPALKAKIYEKSNSDLKKSG